MLVLGIFSTIRGPMSVSLFLVSWFLVFGLIDFVQNLQTQLPSSRSVGSVSEESQSGDEYDKEQHEDPDDSDSFNQEGETTIQAPPPVEMLQNLSECNLKLVAFISNV